MMRSYNGVVGETVFARHNVVNMGTVEETATAVTWVRSEQEYVDLGLSVKWATMNVGATSPEDYGDYFAWGETSTRDAYSWGTYKWCDANNNYSMTKYNDFDGKTILDASDDAAHINWGSAWRMPTYEEMDELCNTQNCKWEWTTQNNVKGYLVTSKKADFTDKSIFFPAAGGYNGSTNGEAGAYGYYLTASRNVSPYYARYMDFASDYVGFGYGGEFYRYTGYPVRPVLQ